MKKGSFGYLQKKRIYSLLKSLFLLAAVLIVYFAALRHYHTNRNIFTLLAAAGALPTGRSIVVTIMCMRAKGASAKVRDAVEAVEGLTSLYSGYDISLTSYDNQYSLSHAAVRNLKVIGLTESDAAQAALCGQHIRQMLEKDGFGDYEVEIFRETDAYVRALNGLCAGMEDQMEDHAAEDRKVMELLYAISL